MDTPKLNLEKQLYKPVKKIKLSELFPNKPPKGKTHAIITIDQTGDILSFCSEDYALRKNSSIYKPFEKLLKEEKLKFNRIITIIDGNKFYVDYIIKSKVKSFIIKDLLLKLSIWNSYDGTVKTQINFGYHKSLCGNSLSRPVNCKIHTSSKHSSDEQEFSKETIPFFLHLFKNFVHHTNSDMKIFETLAKQKSDTKTLEKLSDSLKMSKESKLLAITQLNKETSGNMTYIDEKGNITTCTNTKVTLFSVYNALNYAIYHSNHKELPDMKAKKDRTLLEAIQQLINNTSKV